MASENYTLSNLEPLFVVRKIQLHFIVPFQCCIFNCSICKSLRSSDVSTSTIVFLIVECKRKLLYLQFLKTSESYTLFFRPLFFLQTSKSSIEFYGNIAFLQLSKKYLFINSFFKDKFVCFFPFQFFTLFLRPKQNKLFLQVTTIIKIFLCIQFFDKSLYSELLTFQLQQLFFL